MMWDLGGRTYVPGTAETPVAQPPYQSYPPVSPHPSQASPIEPTPFSPIGGPSPPYYPATVPFSPYQESVPYSMAQPVNDPRSAITTSVHHVHRHRHHNRPPGHAQNQSNQSNQSNQISRSARVPQTPQHAPHFQYSRCTGRRKAVCIGINYFGTREELRGCINDAKNVRKFLLSYGYTRDDVVLLTDDSPDQRLLPTRQNIMNAMHWLVDGAHPHDALFFHYSGHGGQRPDTVPYHHGISPLDLPPHTRGFSHLFSGHGNQVSDTDGDEVDGKDEVIFPMDYRTTGIIVDDEMHKLMVHPLPVGCRLTALFDSCHSASVLDLPYLYHTNGRVKESQVTKDHILEKSTPADVVSWSACKDSQTSADTYEAGVATGAMSYAFMKSLRENPRQTYQELLRSVRDILHRKYSQKPQLSSSHRIDTNLQFIM